MFNVSNIKMCSVSATSELGFGNNQANARNPADADPRLAKCISFVDLKDTG